MPFCRKKREEDWDFFRRIPEASWKYATERLERLPTQSELAVFKKVDFSAPLFQESDWVYLAFAGYLNGDLSITDLTLFFLYDTCQKQRSADASSPTKQWNCSLEERLQVFQLYDSANNRNQKAADVLSESLQKDFSAEEIERFFKLMQESDPKDTYFFSLAREEDPGFDVITSEEDGRWLAFSIRKIDSTLQRQIVPLPSMFFKACQAKFGDQAMRPNPVLGHFAKKEKLSDPSQRVATIPCPFYPLKDQVPSLDTSFHNLASTSLSFYHHDLYHLYIESCIFERPLWITVAKTVNQKILAFKAQLIETSHSPKLKNDLLELYRNGYLNILDREFRLYRNDDISKEAAFWRTFGSEIVPIFIEESELYQDYGINIPELTFASSATFEIFSSSVVDIFTTFKPKERTDWVQRLETTVKEVRASDLDEPYKTNLLVPLVEFNHLMQELLRHYDFQNTA